MRLSPDQTSNKHKDQLHNTLMQGMRGIEDLDFLLNEDDEAYEKILRDAHISGIHRLFKQLVLGQAHSFVQKDPDSGQLVAIFNHLFSFMGEDDIQKFLFNLCDAYLKGMTVAKIEGEDVFTRVPGDTQARWWWVPRKIIDVDKQSVQRIRDVLPDGRVNWLWSIFDWRQNTQVMMEDTSEYIWHFYDMVESHPNGRGIGGSMFYYWHAKAVLYEMMLEGAERWAGGWTVAYIDGLKRKTTDAFAGRSDTADWINELEKMKSHKTIVLSENDKLEVEQGPTQGHQIITDSIKYVDDKIEILILGADLATMSGGSFALAKQKAEEMQAGPILYTRKSIAGAVDKHLVNNNMWRRNLPNLRAMGLGSVRPPKFVMNNAKSFEPAAEIDIIERMSRVGMAVKAPEAYERVGYEQPAPGEEVALIGAPQPAAPSPFGFSKDEQTTFAKGDALNATEDFERISEHTSKPVKETIQDLWSEMVKAKLGGTEASAKK